MDPRAVLAAFDEQVRRDETAEPGDRVESDDSVLRVVSDAGGLERRGVDRTRHHDR